MASVKEPPRRQAAALPRSPALDAIAALEPVKAVAAVKAGLDAHLVRQLADQLRLNLEELAIPLRMAPRTLHRRLEQGRLELDESERLLALIRIFTLAKQTLGSADKAVHWIKSPLQALRGQTPLQSAETQIGLRQIEDILIRIADVVYS